MKRKKIKLVFSKYCLYPKKTWLSLTQKKKKSPLKDFILIYTFTLKTTFRKFCGFVIFFYKEMHDKIFKFRLVNVFSMHKNSSRVMYFLTHKKKIVYGNAHFRDREYSFFSCTLFIPFVVFSIYLFWLLINIVYFHLHYI